MAHLTVELSDSQLDSLQSYAEQRQLPVASLIEAYVAYLVAGGEPILIGAGSGPTAGELAALAMQGGAFDWLADEPDIYTEHDGEPV